MKKLKVQTNPSKVVPCVKAFVLGALVGVIGMAIQFKSEPQTRYERILEPVPESMYIQNTPTNTITPTPTIKKIEPFKKLLTPEAAKIREVILAKIQSEYDETNALALDNIFKKESGYRPDAVNEIGAGGMCQAYPATKMNCPIDNTAEAVTCQLNWCEKYVQSRYGTPEAAWAFHETHNWF